MTAPEAAATPVLPLRPMSVPDVLDGGFRLLRAAPAAVLVPALVVAVLVTVAETALRLALDPAAAAGTFAGVFLTGLVLQLVGSVVGTIGAAVVGAFLAGVLVVSLAGAPLTLASVWRTVRGRLVAALVVGVVVGVLQTVALLFLVVPGVWLWVLFAFAVPATVVERASVTTAVRRSAGLVTSGFWRVLGLRLMAALTALAFSYLFRVPFGLLADQVADSRTASAALVALGTLLTTAVVLPLRAAVDVVLYLDQRIRGEAFDVALTLAARDAAARPAPAGGAR